jgi:MFS family permease
MSYQSAASLVMIVNGIGLPFRILTPILADHYIGVVNTITPVFLAISVLSYCWIAVSSQSSYYAWTCIYGIVNSAFQCLIPTTVSRLTPDLSMIGTRLGMAFSVMSVGALTGPPVGGALISSQHGSYIAAQGWMATSCLVGFIAVAAARIVGYGWRIKVRC